MRILSGHQPVYLPWLGLFHKYSLSDVFVYMDTVQYLEQDWNNRNKIKTPDGWMWLTVPINREMTGGKGLNEVVVDSNTEAGINEWQAHHWKAIRSNYSRAPFFSRYSERFEEHFLGSKWGKLIDLCWAQFQMLSELLELDEPEIVRMTDRPFKGRKSDLILNHCLELGADAVVLGTYGRDYLGMEQFRSRGIKVYFQDYLHPKYHQRFGPFISHLSVIDLLFNEGPNSKKILLANNVSKVQLTSGGFWE